jgi:hypothetical protein
MQFTCVYGIEPNLLFLIIPDFKMVLWPMYFLSRLWHGALTMGFCADRHQMQMSLGGGN